MLDASLSNGDTKRTAGAIVDRSTADWALAQGEHDHWDKNVDGGGAKAARTRR